MIKKIVTVGPESTGKSTLCSQLAEHFNTGWVKEYAREYLLEHGTSYSFENLLEIAKGQIALEDLAIKSTEQEIRYFPADEKKINSISTGKDNARFLFVDTDMYVLKVWCEFVFGKCHHWILNQIVERKYDLYLLCDTDLAWTRDELREYPDLVTREKLYHHYKDIMVNQEVPWVNIDGNYEERLQKAIAAVELLG